VKIAIVTPWFGRELIGGAERHAWELAHALAAAGTDVDVLSTCSHSFNDDWATNFHRAGTTVLADRLRLLRFRVDSRDRVAYGRVTAGLTALPRISLRGDFTPLDERAARTFVAESINSRALAAHVREHAETYDAVIFVPYLYGTTLAVLPHVADRAFLMPCLHDEAYAYVEPVRSCIAAARGLLFLSAGEEETAAAIYGPGIYAKSRVVGASVDPVLPPAAPVTLGGFVPNRSRYVLYLGRQVATKNVDFLVDAYRLFRERRVATSLQLVLAGQRNVSRAGDGIVDVGAVNRDAKAALLTYARALAQPSLHESFSRTIYEAWYARRPVFVHGACRATARAVEDSGGGWIGSTIEEWARMFTEIDESSDDAVDAVGNRGWAAALENGSWDMVVRRVLEAVTPRAPEVARRVDQAVPLGNRDAAVYAGALRDALAAIGCSSEIIVTEASAPRTDVKVVAHVAGSDIPIDGDVYIAHDGEPAFANRSRPVFAVSPAVAARLDDRGFSSKLLAFPVSPGMWDGASVSHQRWLDGRPSIVSLSPLDATLVRRLMDIFVAYVGRARRARLLVFASDCDDEATRTLLHERAELDLEDEIVLVAESRSERYTAFRSATVAIALGRSTNVENIVSAQWFGIPVLGAGDAIAMESIEASGLVETDSDPHRFAALLRLVTDDPVLRSTLSTEGTRAARRHAPATVAMAVMEALKMPEPPLAERISDIRGIDVGRP
jgi:glycosyltransferase involved in cell wall biosynthesis